MSEKPDKKVEKAEKKGEKQEKKEEKGSGKPEKAAAVKPEKAAEKPEKKVEKKPEKAAVKPVAKVKSKVKTTDNSGYYKIEDGKILRTHRTCPKCGTGYFLAGHYDRYSCGHCGYTTFKQKEKKGLEGAPMGGQKRRAPRKRTKTMDQQS